MDETLVRLVNQISEAVGTDAFLEVAENALSEIQGLASPFEAVEPILRILEVNEDADFGMPGPLVHFVEKFFGRGYEQLLLASLRRNPTPHTVSMLNAIVNGVSGAEKETYLKEFDRISADGSASVAVRYWAREFVKMHRQRE